VATQWVFFICPCTHHVSLHGGFFDWCWVSRVIMLWCRVKVSVRATQAIGLGQPVLPARLSYFLPLTPFIFTK